MVEPLPGLPVVRDLIVDMGPFFAAYEALSPALKPAGGQTGQEAAVDPVTEKALEEYTSCILCASCYAACPVTAKNPRYPGPAALAQLYRFHIDPRDAPGHSRLEDADTPDGWWACEFHTNCRRVCPRGVPPDKAIGKARKQAVGLRGVKR
jgi:succinate dehydrogenase / fumarate reductase iron-sulfur subunit